MRWPALKPALDTIFFSLSLLKDGLGDACSVFTIRLGKQGNHPHEYSW